MRRWIWITLAVVLVLGIGIATAAYVLVDAEAIRALVVRRAQAELGRDVALGALELDLLPTPALLARELRVAGEAPDAPLVAADEVRLRVALMPLLSGRVALHAVELAGVGVTLPVGPDGMPMLPELGPPSESPDAGSRESQPAPGNGADRAPEPTATGDDGGVKLSIERLVVEDASLRAGDWQIDDLALTGDIDLEGESELAFRADLPGLGGVRDGVVKLRELAGDAPVVDVAVRVESFELGELARRLDALPEGARVYAEATGPVAARVRGSEVESLQANLELAKVDAVVDTLSVAGSASARAELGGELLVDLTGAAIAAEGTLRKPAGDRLALAGKLRPTLGPDVLESGVLRAGPSEVPFSVDLARQRIEVAKSDLALGPLSPWLLPLSAEGAAPGGEPAAVQAIEGTVEIGGLTVALEPLALSGQLGLSDVVVTLAQGPLSVAGTVQLEGQRITAPLVLGLAGQTTQVRAGYDLGTQQLSVALDAENVQVDPVISALTGESQLTGILAADLDVQGAPELAALSGGGEITLAPGAIRNFSLVKTVLGRLAPIVEQVARARGKDLSRYEKEGFERMNAVVRLREGVLQLEPAVVDYGYARAELRGTVGLVDQALALSGTLTLGPELVSDLLDQETDRSLTVQIPRIAGTLDAPRVDLDASQLAQSVGRLAVQVGLTRGLGDELRERLGEEGGSALQGILEGLGGRRREESR